MKSRKVGTPCSEGGVCHWELVDKLPSTNGKHLVKWHCVKCKNIEEKEVTIQ